MWTLVSDQLDVAERLALDPGARKPRQAPLRRAVSTAYYALFQALCKTCADTLVGPTEAWEAFTPIFRSIEHGRTFAILSERSSSRTHPLGPAIGRIGVAFRELQQAREWADYSPEPHPEPRRTADGFSFSRAEAVTFVAAARAAVSELESLDDATRLKLATLLVTRSRKEARR